MRRRCGLTSKAPLALIQCLVPTCHTLRVLVDAKAVLLNKWKVVLSGGRQTSFNWLFSCSAVTRTLIERDEGTKIQASVSRDMYMGCGFGEESGGSGYQGKRMVRTCVCVRPYLVLAKWTLLKPNVPLIRSKLLHCVNQNKCVLEPRLSTAQGRYLSTAGCR